MNHNNFLFLLLIDLDVSNVDDIADVPTTSAAEPIEMTPNNDTIPVPQVSKELIQLLLMGQQELQVIAHLKSSQLIIHQNIKYL